MLKRFLSTTVAMALALSASAALAATYLSGPLPLEFDGGYIPSGPDGPDFLRNVQRASADEAKLWAAVEKCYAKGARNVAKGIPTGVIFCINDSRRGVLTTYQTRITRIEAQGPGLPACNDFHSGGLVIATLVRAFDSSTYCRSPSGAFVDGTASF